jgi:hypothetical protein
MQTDSVKGTDEGLAHLKQMKNLKTIAISTTNVMAKGVADSKKALFRAEIRS